jgi:hypothetical protein
MRTATRVFGAVSALAILAGLSAAQNSNDSNLNNNGDVVFFYSDPSSGATAGAAPADITGDLYWRAYTGGNFVNDVDATLAAAPQTFLEHGGAAAGASAMEIDGYYESLFDTDFTSTPSFYGRAHTDMAGTIPALGPYSAGTAGITVIIGPSGFGTPCTVAPSLCTAGPCPPPGFVNGWIVDIGFGATVGSGIVITAKGAGGDSFATTYFVTGGMTATGGLCGSGDYTMQDVHSTNETQADVASGINPSGGLQLAGGGLVNEGVTSMLEGHETWRNNIINVRAKSPGGAVETGDNGGGAMNGRNLSVGAGGATIGVELRDFAAVGIPNIGIVGASLTGLPNPGVPALGGNLLVLPDGLFNSTSAIWQGPITGFTAVFTAEGAFNGAQLPVPTTAAGALLHIQGARFNLTNFTLNSTNAVTTSVAP